MAELPGLSEWLRAEIERRGWNQAKLARRSGLSESTVSRLLSGEIRGREVDTQVALAQAFELTYLQLIAAVRGEEPPASPAPDTETAIQHDPDLTSVQKDALLTVYWSYRRGGRL